MKHTKGPWNYIRSSAAGRYIVSAENMPLDICVLSNRDKSAAEIQANAHLIAAAPDLLRAVQYAADVFAGYAALHRAKGPDGEQKALNNQHHLQVMVDAITKSWGES